MQEYFIVDEKKSKLVLSPTHDLRQKEYNEKTKTRKIFDIKQMEF
jgi:hypothetical protein